MNYELQLKKVKLMRINAKNENVAWNILSKAGIKNKSKVLKLVEIK